MARGCQCWASFGAQGLPGRREGRGASAAMGTASPHLTVSTARSSSQQAPHLTTSPPAF